MEHVHAVLGEEMMNVTMDYDSISKSGDAKHIDFMIRGEGELAFNKLVRALMEAARRGAEVVAFVEVKARFDEARNLDWAQEMADVLNNRYAQAEKVIVICDNLNTHTPASFYKAFPPAEARRLAERVEIRLRPRTAVG